MSDGELEKVGKDPAELTDWAFEVLGEDNDAPRARLAGQGQVVDRPPQ